jgi:hypothetical protein
MAVDRQPISPVDAARIRLTTKRMPMLIRGEYLVFVQDKDLSAMISDPKPGLVIEHEHMPANLQTPDKKKAPAPSEGGAQRPRPVVYDEPPF